MEIKDPKTVMQKSLEDCCGLTAYSETLKLREKDVSTDAEYQKNFTSYYRVRRDKEWLRKYYKYLQKNKDNEDITFETILRYLYKTPHKVKKSSKHPDGKAKTVEVSFSSKMLATIKPDKYPVWDKQVIKALGITVYESLNDEDKIKNSIEAYKELTEKINDYAESDEGKECISLFDEVFPKYKDISPLKKIDFYLWNIGKDSSK